MGRNDKDKWLGKLKDSVENHSEPLPDSFWEDIKRNIPAAAPVVQSKKIIHTLMWPVAAAAVVLLGLVLLLPQEQTSSKIAQVEEKVIVSEDTEMLIAEQSGQDKKLPSVDGKKLEQANTGNDAVQLVQDQTVVQDKGEEQTEQNKGQERKTREQKSEVVKEKKSEAAGKDSGAEREAYLRELEYLSEDVQRRGGARKKMMALALGNGGVDYGSLLSGFTEAATDKPLPGSDGTVGTVGTGAANVVPENFASYINMGGQPVEEITWLGGKSPAVFNNSVTYKNYTYTHKEPVKLGLSFAMELGRGFYVESGMSYQYLASKMKSESISQKLHYVGIPVKVGVNFMRDRKFQVYLSGGYLVEKCVYGILEMPDKEDLKLKVKGVMNSLNVTAGLQLRVGNFTSLYLEPGLYRYLGMGEEIGREHGYILKNIYNEKPSGISLQGGLRFLF